VRCCARPTRAPCSPRDVPAPRTPRHHRPLRASPRTRSVFGTRSPHFRGDIRASFLTCISRSVDHKRSFGQMKPPHHWGGQPPLRLADVSAGARIVDDDLQGGALPVFAAVPAVSSGARVNSSSTARE
jgi:hypothetical protein